MPFHLRFGAMGLQHCRFAISPLWETQEAVRTLDRPHRHGYHLPWLRRIRHAAAGLDLSPLRVAGVGAEPIQPETLRSFARRYAPCGFHDSAFAPSYGMAESTLAIAIARGLRIDRVSAAALAGRGVAEPVPELSDEPAVELTSCGGPLAGHHLEIVEPASGAARGERQVGEIWVRGDQVSGEYSSRRATVDEGWFPTNDAGYFDTEGFLFIEGRIDDVIVLHRLTREEIEKIVAIQLQSLAKTVADRGIELNWSPAALRFLAGRGYDPTFGARPLKRLIQKAA